MNLNVKALTILLSAGIVFSLSGCGSDSDSTPAGPSLGDQTILPDGSIEYVDYTGDTRIAAPTAGAAEYHTGVDFNHTLFDSADKKCQHCHNELYDTWQSSMHSKSWTDGIFQSKYQDFLRVQLSKIESSSPNATYKMATITGGPSTVVSSEQATSDKRVPGGMAKVCLKCHAPGAYYAGDFNITVKKLTDAGNYLTATTEELSAAIASAGETNLAGKPGYTGTNDPTTVAAVGTDGNLYTATYHIGHEANREGINCATCHSIESIRLMADAGDVDGVRDDGIYTLKNAIKYGPLGAERYPAGTVLDYDKNASDPHMNAFFTVLGPDLYNEIHNTPQDATGMNDPDKKLSDGRFTMKSVEINGTDGKTHYTGGPFYGPYGITGTDNSNPDDNSSRLATSLGKDVFEAKDNHFSKHAKALCLSCHQRSAGAKDKNAPVAGNQMELCSTWNGMTGGDTDNNWLDSASSPKCTKCHMPRLNDKTVLHKWAKPDELFTRDELLTGYFDPEDGDGYGETHNPVVGKWMNDHGFIGANKQTGANYLNKIKSGFEADVNASINGNELTVNTTLLNKTAHMFPGAHPMRRMLTRVIVTDEDGNMVPTISAVGDSDFENIVNTVVPSNANDTVNTTGTGRGSVGVEYDGARKIEITGLQADLNGSKVTSQRFDPSTQIIPGADNGTLSFKFVDNGVTKGTVTVNHISEDTNTSTFTRIYGRETGKEISNTFIVRPGFDSNTVTFDNRLVPNKKEIYTIKYAIEEGVTYNVTYKVYYLLTGANGFFPTGEDGWYEVDNPKKDRIDEVFTKTVNP